MQWHEIICLNIIIYFKVEHTFARGLVIEISNLGMYRVHIYDYILCLNRVTGYG
jgi:hypothetical protein